MVKLNSFQILHWECTDLMCPGPSPRTQKHHSVSQSNQPTKISLLLENSVQLPDAKLLSAHLLPATHTQLHVSTCPPEIRLPQGGDSSGLNLLLVSQSPKEHMPSQELHKNITTLTQASRSFPGCRLTSPSPYFKHNLKKPFFS